MVTLAQLLGEDTNDEAQAFAETIIADVGGVRKAFKARDISEGLITGNLGTSLRRHRDKPIEYEGQTYILVGQRLAKMQGGTSELTTWAYVTPEDAAQLSND